MTNEEAVDRFRDFLKSVPGYSLDAFALCENFLEVIYLKRGDVFVERDKTCRKFAFVAEGIMRGFTLVEGNENTTCICSENAFATSTLSFITQTPSNIAIQALNNVCLVTMSHEQINELYKKSPFWETVGRVVAEKEFVALQQSAWRNSPISAEAKYLILLKENPGIVNRIPLHFIASYIGVTPETLSRIRKRITLRKS